MRRSLFLLCAICTSFMATQADAQPGNNRGGESGGNFSGERQRPPRAAVPVDEDLRQIQLEIAILDVPAAEVAAQPLKDDEQLARLGRLETDGKLAGVQRMKTTLIANQIAKFQMGETVQVVTGRSGRSPGDPAARGGFGGGGFNEIRTAQPVGTMVTVTARPIAGGAVAEIQLERSGIVTPKQTDAAEGAVNDYPKSRTMTISSTVLFADAETKIIGSNQQAKSDGKEETWVLAKVTVGASVKPVAANSTINIFQLKNLRAKDAAVMIDMIFIGKNIRAVADARTNTAIVVSAPNEEMKQIEAILLRLDQSDAGQPTSKTLEPTPDPLGNDAPQFAPEPAKKRPAAPPGREPLDELDPSSR